MDYGTIALLIALATLGLNLFINIKGGAWGLADRFSTMETKIMTAVAAQKSTTDANVESIRKEFEAKIDAVEGRFGETITGMRSTVHNIEVWARDEFVRKGSFEIVLARYENAQIDRDKDMKERLGRLETKIDELQGYRRRQPPPGHD